MQFSFLNTPINSFPIPLWVCKCDIVLSWRAQPFPLQSLHFPSFSLSSTPSSSLPSRQTSLLFTRLPPLLSIRPSHIPKSALASIKLPTRLISTSLQLHTTRHGLVSTKPLAHVNHASLALSVALFELLASRRKSFGKRQSEAVGGCVAVDQHAVACY